MRKVEYRAVIFKNGGIQCQVKKWYGWKYLITYGCFGGAMNVEFKTMVEILPYLKGQCKLNPNRYIFIEYSPIQIQ